jgi:hypothetical protein
MNYLARVFLMYSILLALLTRIYAPLKSKCSKSLQNFLIIYDMIIFTLVTIKVIFFLVELNC